MALIIKHPQGIFDTDPEFNLDIELTNPIYTERGSMTYPATLPPTAHNRIILANAQRLDIVKAPETDVRVTVDDGVYHRTGKLNVISAGQEAGITVNVGFDEGEMYALFEDTALSSLNWPEENWMNASLAADWLELVMQETVSHRYAVFPIQTGGDTVDNTYYPEYLNKITYNGSYWHLVSEARYENCISNGAFVKTMLPEGYGCTPFLKVHYILSFIFEHFGYKLVENPFATHPQLKRLVVLNSVADAIVKGYIRYAELLPDCTINEFFNALYARTGMVYFVNGADKTVRIKFIKDIVTAHSTTDWKRYLAASPTVSFAEPKRVVLSASTGFDDTEPQKDTIKQFLSQYNYKVVEDKKIINTAGEPVSEEVLNGEAPLFYEKRTGRYFEYDFIDKSIKFKSTEFFPWDLEDDAIEKEEITGDDECVAVALMKWGDTESIVPRYMAGYVHLHTVLSKSKEDEKETDIPLAFCFAMPKKNGVPYGSTYCYDSAGDQVRDSSGNVFNLSLTFTGENGAFNRFWKEYDGILRHANHTVECEMNLPRPKLFSLDLSAPVLVDGQRLLIESVKHTLPLVPNSPPTVKLRTLKLLEPYNLYAEQRIETGRPWFKWRIVNGMYATAQKLMEEWAAAKGYDIRLCRYEIDTKNYTEFPEGGDFPLKPPLSINDPDVVCYYKMKLRFRFAGFLRAFQEEKYPVTATPEYTFYWSLDHAII